MFLAPDRCRRKREVGKKDRRGARTNQKLLIQRGTKDASAFLILVPLEFRRIFVKSTCRPQLIASPDDRPAFLCATSHSVPSQSTGISSECPSWTSSPNPFFRSRCRSKAVCCRSPHRLLGIGHARSRSEPQELKEFFYSNTFSHVLLPESDFRVTYTVPRPVSAVTALDNPRMTCSTTENGGGAKTGGLLQA